jgi:error-prone DNA polymerase
VICPPAVWERHRRFAITASALIVQGRVERLDGAVSLLAGRLRRIRAVPSVPSRDFR